MTGAGRDRTTGIEDAWAGYLACGYGIAQRQDHAVTVTQIPHCGEARCQRLASIDRGLIGDIGNAVGNVGQLPFDAGLVRGQVDMAVDQPLQHEAGALIDHRSIRGNAVEGAGSKVTIAHRFDPVVADQQRRLLARSRSWPVEQGAGMDQRVAVGGVGGCRKERGDQA